MQLQHQNKTRDTGQNERTAFNFDRGSNKTKIKQRSDKHQRKANYIYDSIKNNYPSDEVMGFNASSSNFRKFKQWYGFCNFKLSEE
jgi:hypothetical protein